MFKEEFNYALSICLVVLLFFGAMPPNLQGHGYDYDFHYSKARGEYQDIQGRPTISYPPLFHWLASPFAFQEKQFYLFALFLLAFVTPMLLFFCTRSWVSIVFYFCATEYFYLMEQGIYAQALIGIMLLIFLLTKNKWHRFLLVVISPLAHASGLLAIVSVWFFTSLQESGLLKKAACRLKNGFWAFLGIGILPGCSGVLGKDRPNEILDARVIELVDSHQSMHGFKISYILKYVFQIFPLPFLYWAGKALWEKEEFSLLCLIAFFTVTGLFVNYRIWYFIPLVAIPGLVCFYKKLGKKSQKYFMAFVLLYGALQFYIWLNYKMQCFFKY